MMAARFRLVAAALLFACWLGWLSYLAFTASRPIVLSRPQFMASTLDVIAQISQQSNGYPDAQIRVQQVWWPENKNQGLKGQLILVKGLPENVQDGWMGPGTYIVPLVQEGNSFRLASIPPSPGFDWANHPRRPIIYPQTAETTHQLQTILKP